MPQKTSEHLLAQMMVRLGERRDEYPMMVWTSELVDLVPGHEELGDDVATVYVVRHAKFLEEEGYVIIGEMIGDSGDHLITGLTSLGEKFLQPELVQFGNTSLLPDIIKTFQTRLDHVVDMPQEDRSGLMNRLYKAIANNAVEVAVKIIAEIAVRTAQG